jgi:hypothetical protein
MGRRFEPQVFGGLSGSFHLRMDYRGLECGQTMRLSHYNEFVLMYGAFCDEKTAHFLWVSSSFDTVPLSRIYYCAIGDDYVSEPQIVFETDALLICKPIYFKDPVSQEIAAFWVVETPHRMKELYFAHGTLMDGFETWLLSLKAECDDMIPEMQDIYDPWIIFYVMKHVIPLW